MKILLKNEDWHPDFPAILGPPGLSLAAAVSLKRLEDSVLKTYHMLMAITSW